MDVDETLDRIRRIVSDHRDERATMDDYGVLADLVGDLDAWIKRGGYIPADWQLKGRVYL